MSTNGKTITYDGDKPQYISAIEKQAQAEGREFYRLAETSERCRQPTLLFLYTLIDPYGVERAASCYVLDAQIEDWYIENKHVPELEAIWWWLQIRAWQSIGRKK
jgi:hypothetical protein